MGYCWTIGTHWIAIMVAPGMRRSESREKTGSGFRRSLLASLTALAVITTPSVVVAEDDNSGFSGNRLWTNQLQDYALKSLQNEDAMSMAAIPLFGTLGYTFIRKRLFGREFHDSNAGKSTHKSDRKVIDNPKVNFYPPNSMIRKGTYIASQKFNTNNDTTAIF